MYYNNLISFGRSIIVFGYSQTRNRHSVCVNTLIKILTPHVVEHQSCLSCPCYNNNQVSDWLIYSEQFDPIVEHES